MFELALNYHEDLDNLQEIVEGDETEPILKNPDPAAVDESHHVRPIDHPQTILQF